MLEIRQLRFKVLKIIYQQTNPKDISHAISRKTIFKQIEIDWEELLSVLSYLCSLQLIELAYDDGLEPYYIITAQGINEVETIEKQPNPSNDLVPNQIFNNTFLSTIGTVQQGGQGNISYVTQNLGLDEVSLDNNALNKLQELVHKLTTNTTNDLSPTQAYQAAAILIELKEAALNQDKNGQIQAVSKWRQWLNKTGANTQKALSIVADCVSLGLPLAKLLGFPVP